MEFDGQVIAAFGRHLLLKDADGREVSARPFGRQLVVVCGDRVRCRRDAHHDEAHVLSIEKRASCLYRSNARGEAEPVVANLTLLLVTLAPLPQPDFFVVDRYLCAASSAGLDTRIIVNKCELEVEPAVRAELQAYARAGFGLIECSARSELGIAALRSACGGAVAAIVGQSGVGKSSLVRRLVPQADIATGELVRASDGRHTTTTSRLYELAEGGRLIDSPGVRDFAPALAALEPRSLGFIEIAQLAPQCRFSDCRHMREPDCAVRAALESGAIHARR